MVKKINRIWRAYQRSIDNIIPFWIELMLFIAASYGFLTSNTDLLLYTIFSIFLLR